jgi:hypothetical protein
MKNKNVACKNCGWIHFTVSAKYVHDWLREWVEFWIKSTPETRDNYGMSSGPPSPRIYLHCFSCGSNYKNFIRPTKLQLEKITGCTINPILDKNEKL